MNMCTCICIHIHVGEAVANTHTPISTKHINPGTHICTTHSHIPKSKTESLTFDMVVPVFVVTFLESY